MKINLASQRPAARARPRRRACSRTTAASWRSAATCATSTGPRRRPSKGIPARRPAHRGCASRRCTTRAGAARACHVVTIDVNSQPYTLADGHWDDIKDKVADAALARLATVHARPAGPDPAPAGAQPARPRARPLASPAATRCTATCPSTSCSSFRPVPRLGGLPHASRRPVPLRCGHAPRRWGHRRQRPQLRRARCCATQDARAARSRRHARMTLLTAPARHWSRCPGRAARRCSRRSAQVFYPGRPATTATRSWRRASPAGWCRTSTATSSSTWRAPRPRCRSARAASRHRRSRRRDAACATATRTATPCSTS